MADTLEHWNYFGDNIGRDIQLRPFSHPTDGVGKALSLRQTALLSLGISNSFMLNGHFMAQVTLQSLRIVITFSHLQQYILRQQDNTKDGICYYILTPCLVWLCERSRILHSLPLTLIRYSESRW